ncbi:hypothetical protein PR001_g30145, partial [Phytophthora rubi]
MFWFRMKEGSGIMAPARVGKSEVAVVEPVEVKVFAEIADMDTIPATKWDAAAHATGEFVKSTASLLILLPEAKLLEWSIRRDFMFEESMEHLGCIEEKYMQSVMRTNFIEESGVGAGGLHHEWFMMLTELLTNTKAGLFKAMQGEDRAFFLNSSSRYDNRVPGTLLCMDEVKYFDPEVYKRILWMLENDGVEVLDLDFGVMERVGDRMTVVLLSNGRNIEVTDAIKHEYLEHKFEHLLLLRSVVLDLVSLVGESSGCALVVNIKSLVLASESLVAPPGTAIKKDYGGVVAAEDKDDILTRVALATWPSTSAVASSAS